MRGLQLFLLVALPLAVLSKPSPQDVNPDDVFGEDEGDGTRYNAGSTGNNNPDVVNDVFGINKGTPQPQPTKVVDNYSENNNFGTEYVPPPPEKQIVDTSFDLCTDYADQGYQCVDFLQCDEFGEIITGGQGLIDKRSNFGQTIEINVEDSKCPGSLEVCCRRPEFTDPVKPKPKPYISRCGNHNVQGIGVRIQNYPADANTQFGEWPHMCAVLEAKNGKNLYVSGASLIAPDIVLTAAHSVEKYATNQKNHQLIVRCGEWDTQRTIEPLEHQDRNVFFINSHPGFSSSNLTNNVALLHVSEPFLMAPNVDVMCIGEEYDYAGCVATGWGKDQFGADGKYQVIMKQVDLNVVPHDQCQAALRTTRLGENFELDYTALCAGGEARVDTCKGDGGGPLVCPKKGSVVRDAYDSPQDVPQYVQAGIVGWGIGCGEDGIPGVYTDVSSVMCFINEAARCVLGNQYIFGPDNCAGWFNSEYERISYAIASYKYQADYAESRQQKAIFIRRLKEHQALLATYDQWKAKCETFHTQDLTDDNYSGTDLSDLVRANANADSQ